MSTVSDTVDVGRQVASNFAEKNVTLMAAGIAYNAFVSLVPLFILLLLVVSIVGGGLRTRLVGIVEGTLPAPIADVLVEIFNSGPAATGVSLLGLFVLIWGTLKVFRGLDTAFSAIYETGSDASLVDQFVEGFVVMIALVVAVVATIAASVLFSMFADTVPFAGILSPLALVLGLAATFAPLYYRFPDANLGWRNVLPGALFAAVGWAVLQGLFQVYLIVRGSGSESFFGGVIIVITWLYFSGLVLLVGALLNAVLSGHASDSTASVGPTPAATAGVVTSRRSLSRDELSTYLRTLRRRLDGQGQQEPAAASDQTAVPGPDTVDEFEVVEHTADDGDERAVTLRWRTDHRDPEE